MLLTEEQVLIQQAAREFAQQQLKPNSAEWAKKHTFPKDALSQMAELGFFGMLVPEAWGGHDIGYIAYTLVLEEIAAGDASCSTILSVHNSVACMPILRFGTTEQKETFLRPLAMGQKLGAFCLTEPQAGSDAANLQMQAQKEGDNYILNGTKQFITSGKNADIAIVFAKTDKSAGKKGITAFIVPTDTPGYQVSTIEEKMGQEASDTAQIVLQDVRLSASHRLGEEGEGYKIALSNLEGGRIGIAAQSIGMARAALAHALDYAKERQSFGKPLSQHQAIQFRLADMATQIEAAHQMNLHAASLREAGQPCLKEACMAKLFASEAAETVCREAIQVHGGYGYLREYEVERIYRDVRVTSIYEGTSDVQRMVIGRELLR